MNPESISEEDKGRFIEVWWDTERSTSYIANLKIEAQDRDGVLMEITNILSTFKIPFKSINAYVTKKGIAIIQIGVEIRNTSDLALLKKKITQIHGVTSVTRLQN
jgi:GTP pyrophosphokinase